MAKKKHFRRESKLPIGATVGLIASLWHPIQYAMAGNYASIPTVLSEDFLGYSLADGSFDVNRLKRGLQPLLMGVAISWIASKFGLNRHMPKGLPIRI